MTATPESIFSVFKVAFIRAGNVTPWLVQLDGYWRAKEADLEAP